MGFWRYVYTVFRSNILANFLRPKVDLTPSWVFFDSAPHNLRVRSDKNNISPAFQTLTVYRSDAVIDEAEPDVQTYYFRTVRLSDGQTNTEAVVKLKPIEA